MNTTTNHCPACRSPLTAMATKCEACGTEIQAQVANKTVLSLSDRFEGIAAELTALGLTGNELQAEVKLRKGRIIRDFPVPNSREDLLSLLHYIAPRLDGGGADPNIEEWRAKFREVAALAKSSFKNNAKARAEVEEIERSVQVSMAGELKSRAKRSPVMAISVIVVIAVALVGLVGVELQKSKLGQCEEKYDKESITEKARLDAIFTKATGELKGGSFTDALGTTSALRWDLRSDCKRDVAASMASQWDQKRSELESLIRSEEAKFSADKKAAEVKLVTEERAAEAKRVTEERVAAEKRAVAEAAAASKAATAVRKAATEKEY